MSDDRDQVEPPLPVIERLAELAAFVRANPGVHVRWSEGPGRDAESTSLKTESGLRLPCLSINPLEAEGWWTRPLEDWLARQLSQYRHLQDENPDRIAWVLRGEHTGRGPDCERLLGDPEPMAVLDERLLQKAEERYHAEFDAGRGPEA